MNLIGHTASGALIVEMTPDEWTLVCHLMHPDQPDAPKKPNEWAKQMDVDLLHLHLDTRAYGYLSRCAFGYYGEESRSLVFAINNKYLDFESWILGIAQRNLRIVPGIGPKVEQVILRAAYDYLEKKDADS